MIARGDLLKIPTSSKTGDLYGGQLINKKITISEKQGINGVREDLPKKQGTPPQKKALMVLQPNLLFRAEVICRTVVRLRAGMKNDQLPYIVNVQCTSFSISYDCMTTV